MVDWKKSTYLGRKQSWLFMHLSSIQKWKNFLSHLQDLLNDFVENLLLKSSIQKTDRIDMHKRYPNLKEELKKPAFV